MLSYRRTINPLEKSDTKSHTKNTDDIISNISGSSNLNMLCYRPDRLHDTISFRLNFIKEILSSSELRPMVNIMDDPSELSTEVFVNPNEYKNRKINNVHKILNKKKYNFYNFVNNIGGGSKIAYIKSGSTGHTFRGNIKIDNDLTIHYGIKVVAFRKKDIYGDITDVKRPENAELMMIRLLSYFVINKQTPHIVLPIGTFNTDIEPFIRFKDLGYVKNKKYEEFVTKYEKKQYHNTVSILISEWANRGDLLDFIRKTYKEFTLKHWKVLFFQIISVLAIIQSKYPGFRHNDLKANNILVQQTLLKKDKVFVYTIKRHQYYIPHVGYSIKIWDFDFACIPGIIDNSKVNAQWTNDINVNPVRNRYYDLHYFFNTFIKKGFFPELMTDKTVPKEVKEFVNRVVPPKFQSGENVVTDKGRILHEDEYTTPNIILKTDPFFQAFRSGNNINELRELLNT